MMKNIKYLSIFLIAALSAVIYFSCGSTPKAEPEPVAVEIPAEPVPEPAPAPVEDDEYSKSVGSLTVSKDTFETDKAEILHIIDNLSTIMKDYDYNSWVLYVDAESVEYWSKPVNLKKAQSKLPVKGLMLRTLQDYFKYVFVPARSGRTVSTIRYVSDSYVKAVQITAPTTEESEEKYTVYYYFNKINGHWALNLPKIEN